MISHYDNELAWQEVCVLVTVVFSATSAPNYQTTTHHTPEDNQIHNKHVQHEIK
jgi:hypothetical protein